MALTVLLGILLGGLAARAQNAVILNGMKDELARSMAQLRLEQQSAPYYLSYQVKEGYSLEISATSGAITRNRESTDRYLTVDLRVGDYAFDNSHFSSWFDWSGGPMYSYGGGGFPLDDDYSGIRRSIWLATDQAYKSALETLARKKAALQNSIRADSLPDFTPGEKVIHLQPEARVKVPRSELVNRIEEASKLFLRFSQIQKSEIELEVHNEDVYFITSEGVESVEPRVRSTLTINAETQADDGMPLKTYRNYVFSGPADVPSPQDLAKDINQIVSELTALRKAPLIEDYDGPVLFEKEAAAEIFAQGFVPGLLANRAEETGNIQFSMHASPSGNSLLSKVNRKVLAKSWSVKASPALRTYKGIPLFGSYNIDDEGVRAREVSLVENGILKNVLVSRSPVKGFGRSNGHFRGGSVSPSVIFFLSNTKTSYPKLKKALIERVKEDGLDYGFIVRALVPLDEGGLSRYSFRGEELRLNRPVLAYRIYPDGKEELVRGADFGTLNVRAFRNIVAAGDEEWVYNYPLQSSGPFATILAPAFILPDVDIKKVSGNYRQPPIVSYPFQ